MSLKPFTYPLPETRFLHAGTRVYKFKIKYGNTVRDKENNKSILKELEEAIRVILGNLETLHPFTTEHFIIFPYLSKWERVSKLGFKHGSTFLVPYPYVCTMYVEFSSCQQNILFGKFTTSWLRNIELQYITWHSPNHYFSISPPWLPHSSPPPFLAKGQSQERDCMCYIH
uniref:Membrane anchored junction protein n=1 Tax=Sphenodon punctatus TaxID=8508 RepID=A0A8D0HAU7_SPHPU